jgi:hypothetical protein
MADLLRKQFIRNVLLGSGMDGRLLFESGHAGGPRTAMEEWRVIRPMNVRSPGSAREFGEAEVYGRATLSFVTLDGP